MFEGDWAGLSLLDDDSVCFSDTCEDCELEKKTTVEVTVDGALAITSDLYSNDTLSGSVNLIRSPEDDLLDDVAALGTTYLVA